MLYSGFNILPRSAIRSANSIGRSDNLGVIQLSFSHGVWLQFSIKTLTALTAISAVIATAFANFGLGFVPVGLGLAFLTAGHAAHANAKLIPFWKAMIPIALFMFLLPIESRYQSDEEVILSAFLIGVSAVCSCSAVRHGHWATKIIGAVVFVPIVAFISVTLYDGFCSWSNVVYYWSNRLAAG